MNGTGNRELQTCLGQAGFEPKASAQKSGAGTKVYFESVAGRVEISDMYGEGGPIAIPMHYPAHKRTADRIGPPLSRL